MPKKPRQPQWPRDSVQGDWPQCANCGEPIMPFYTDTVPINHKIRWTTSLFTSSAHPDRGPSARSVAPRTPHHDRRSQRMKTFPYPFEQFCDHFRAMPVVREYETVQLGYPTTAPVLEIGQSKNFEAQSLRLLDYMSQVIGDRDEQAYKASRLMSAMMFLAANTNAFRAAALVRENTESTGPLMVSPYLVRAVHHYFGAEQMDPMMSVATVIALARGTSRKITWAEG